MDILSFNAIQFMGLFESHSQAVMVCPFPKIKWRKCDCLDLTVPAISHEKIGKSEMFCSQLLKIQY